MADPRLTDPAETVNERLQDRAIRHGVYLARLQTQEAREVLRFIDRDIIPDLEDQISRRMARIEERGYDIGPDTTDRLNDMLSAMRDVTKGGLADIRRRAQERMVELGRQEAEWQAGTINDVLGVEVDWAMPAAQQIRDAVLTRPFDGMPMSDWFEGLARSAQRNVERAIRQGIVEGETVGQIVRRVRGTRAAGITDGAIAATRRQAEAIARTAVIHASAQSRELLYQENADLVKEVQWISTLDTATCPRCAALDGKTFPVDEGPRPSLHPNCRCSTAPVLFSARSVGIDLDLPEATRASMDGGVPESMTYGQWLRRQVNAGNMAIVEEALGKSRAKLFAAGGLKVDSFVAGGRTLTLDQLRAKEAAVFERLNL